MIFAISASMRREVVLGERAVGEVDVVVEAVRVVGPKASLTPGKSRMMARAMMWAVEWRRTSRASRSRLVRRRSSIGSAWPSSSGRSRSTIVAVGHGGDGGLGEPLADPLGDLAGADALGILLDRPVRQLDLDHRPFLRSGPSACAGARPSDPQRRPGPAPHAPAPGPTSLIAGPGHCQAAPPLPGRGRRLGPSREPPPPGRPGSAFPASGGGLGCDPGQAEAEAGGCVPTPYRWICRRSVPSP